MNISQTDAFPMRSSVQPGPSLTGYQSPNSTLLRFRNVQEEKMQVFLLTLALLSAFGIGSSSSTPSYPLKSVWSTLYPDSLPVVSECSGCAQNKVLDDGSDPTLTELRVEYVKQQILKKLRLSKPPDVSMSLSTLPKPLINGHVLELGAATPHLAAEKQAESFYGKTDQVVVFPKEGIANSKKCLHNSNHLVGSNPAACFSFYLPNEMQFVDVTSAELWFYKEENESDALNQTFVLSELDHWDQGRSFQKNTLMAIFETTVREGWVRTDVGFSVKKWVEKRKLAHAVQIACSTCDSEPPLAPVSLESPLKPFLVIHTSPLPQKNRPKRNSNCLPEMRECCRDELYISFKDIGWSDWILHPSGYNAYFCRGSCSSAASLTVAGSPYSNMIRRLLAKNGNGSSQGSAIVPCCSPTQLSPIQLLYVDTNNTITQKTLPNMVVEACGCM